MSDVPAAAAACDDAGADERPNYALHVGLFAVTCATTYWFGGVAFSATLMAILVCHEMGHYVVARRHGIPASLPYFVPLPPQVSLGTLGAVIRMKRPIEDRNKLIDVGAAGPIAGLVVAVPLLIIGIGLSPVEPTVAENAVTEGNSLAYIAIKYAVTGHYLPAADGSDVQLHPMAFAAWVGLLITMINLIPVGQLDGGHIACAYLGDRHERSSRWIHRALLVVGAAVVAFLVFDARGAGKGLGASFEYAIYGGMPWLVWAGLLLLMRRLSGGVYHPPVGEAPLTTGRKRLVVAMAIVFVAIFTPIPMRPTL